MGAEEAEAQASYETEVDVYFDFLRERSTADDCDPRRRAEVMTSGVESLLFWGVLVNDSFYHAADMD